MPTPVILFGAFDRHNFGDLLLPHIAAALMPGHHVVFAGLAQRDLRRHGGHRVKALSGLGLDSGDHPCILIHVGGEILTCDAWQAAVMLLPPEQAPPTIAYLENRPQERIEWVRRMVGTAALAPYAVSRRAHPGLVSVIYNAVGGTAIDQTSPELRLEVLDNLRAADAVSVRDGYTLGRLAAAGIRAALIPDPAVMVAELFGARIRARACAGEVAQTLGAFPQGYMAIQFSADFGDDESLTQIAAQLNQVAHHDGCGVVLFRAGAAPWHDDLACLRRVAVLLRPGSTRLFHSLDLWDICALIANSRAYCGSSLHGRIVATAFARPRVNLRHPTASGLPSKQAAFAATWDEGGVPAEVELRDIAQGIHAAQAVEQARLQHQARLLAGLYRQKFMEVCPAPT
jgi:hypothetical protein